MTFGAGGICCIVVVYLKQRGLNVNFGDLHKGASNQGDNRKNGEQDFVFPWTNKYKPIFHVHDGIVGFATKMERGSHQACTAFLLAGLEKLCNGVRSWSSSDWRKIQFFHYSHSVTRRLTGLWSISSTCKVKVVHFCGFFASFQKHSCQDWHISAVIPRKEESCASWCHIVQTPFWSR